MARLPRIVLPGVPHHVTQLGNRRGQVFFGDDDYALYLDLVADAARQAGCSILAYCLMPNHVHFVVVPGDEDGLRATFGEAHRQYTAHINARNRWTGHLWQGRFASVAMDDEHTWAAIRYVVLNPVKAGLCARAEGWPWSSAAACLAGDMRGAGTAGSTGTPNTVSPNDTNDIIDVAAVLARTGDFGRFLYGSGDDELAAFAAIDKASSTGRPVGSADWLTAMAAATGKQLLRGKPGPKSAAHSSPPGKLIAA